MREIKFRGKDEQGQWHYGNLVRYTEDDGEQVTCIVSTARCEISAELVFVPVDEKTVGQFTGLQDDDGNDMYEGDVIRVFSLWYNGNCYIGVHNAQFAIFAADNGALLGYFRGKAPLRHIIGNIYDNPELMKEYSAYDG